MEITLTVPEHLVPRIRQVEQHLPQILELGIREWQGHTQDGFSGLQDVLEVLATLPAPEEVLALRPTPALQERVGALLARSHNGGLSEEEQREWDRYQYIEHLVRLAKARAAIKLGTA